MKIDKKIIGWSIKDNQESVEYNRRATDGEIQLQHERPTKIPGFTFKLRCQHWNNAFYVTVNVMDWGNGNRPYEIFINTQNEDVQMWLAALTKSWSAVMRAEEGEIQFLVEELIDINDPRGGHASEKKFHKSLIAEIGWLLKGIMENTIWDHVKKQKQVEIIPEYFKEPELKPGEFISKVPCLECKGTLFRMLDGCATCICGWSKCG